MAGDAAASSNAQLQAEVDRLLPELTRAEKVALVTGRGMWGCSGVRRLGLAPLVLSDGPHGCRRPSTRGQDGAMLAPCESALGATFDPGVPSSHYYLRSVSRTSRPFSFPDSRDLLEVLGGLSLAERETPGRIP